MSQIRVKVPHQLDLNMFSTNARDALDRLLRGEWDGFTVNQANIAITTLHETLRQTVGANGPAPAEPRTLNEKRAIDSRPEDLRRCIFALGEVWAILWYQRGKFQEKLEHYQRRNQENSLRPLENVYLLGLEKLQAELDRVN